MPETVTKYKIFLASPSDLADERICVDETIQEINQTFGTQNGIIIELIKWETHSGPAIGLGSVQSIINADVGNSYDLFIGVLWKKFGTPTDKADSGTEEEFLHAYERFTKNPDSLQILFYFKTAAPLSLSDINPEELKKVNDFKKSIGDKSVLYWEFNTTMEFQKFLRIHIPKRLSELKDAVTKEITPIITIEKKEDEIIKIDEQLGILDYSEIIEESFQDATKAITMIVESTEWIGEEINKKADEITQLQVGKTELSKKVIREFLVRTAKIMNDYAIRIEPEIIIFSENFEKGLDSFSTLLNLYKSDSQQTYNSELQTNLETLRSFLPNISGAINGMTVFLNSIINLPPMSKELNRARNNVETRLREFINKLEISYSIASELQKDLDN